MSRGLKEAFGEAAVWAVVLVVAVVGTVAIALVLLSTEADPTR